MRAGPLGEGSSATPQTAVTSMVGGGGVGGEEGSKTEAGRSQEAVLTA